MTNTNKRRKPVVRRFLKKNYELLSTILIGIALVVLIGIGGYMIDANGTLLPIHTPMIISAVISALLGFGLIWIYKED